MLTAGKTVWLDLHVQHSRTS